MNEHHVFKLVTLACTQISVSEFKFPYYHDDDITRLAW